MDEECFKLCEQFVDVKQSIQALHTTQSLFKTLLSQRQLPKEGWNDSVIELFLNQISQMDTNNYVTNIGVGEREGRLYSTLVQKRNFYLSHGIGRSGDITSNQPKAAGSSLLHGITDCLILHAIKLSGGTAIQKAVFVPMCTGMTLSLVMSVFGAQKKLKNSKAKYVLWSRIDQKSCFKSIFSAGLEPVIIELVQQKDVKIEDEKLSKMIKENEDALSTNLEELEKKMKELKDDIVCVLSTTSCFAPRLPDRIVDIAKLCNKYDIPHVINNAYGLQSKKIMNQITTACNQGRVDAIVQSTDKNFLVPVGGAIISSPSPKIIDSIAKFYSGRGAISNLIDLFITLVSMGEKGWIELLKSRESLIDYFTSSLEKVAKKHKEKLLCTKRNEISFAFSLENFKKPSEIGSKLFYRNISGARVVDKTTISKIEIIEKQLEYKFKGYGSHCDQYPYSYITIACAIGITKKDIDLFIGKFDQVLEELNL